MIMMIATTVTIIMMKMIIILKIIMKVRVKIITIIMTKIMIIIILIPMIMIIKNENPQCSYLQLVYSFARRRWQRSLVALSFV